MKDGERINALRKGIGRLTAALDERWALITTVSERSVEVNYTYYFGLTKAIELLGGDWKRDENGKHRVFIAGVTYEVDNED